MGKGNLEMKGTIQKTEDFVIIPDWVGLIEFSVHEEQFIEEYHKLKKLYTKLCYDKMVQAKKVPELVDELNNIYNLMSKYGGVDGSEEERSRFLWSVIVDNQISISFEIGCFGVTSFHYSTWNIEHQKIFTQMNLELATMLERYWEIKERYNN